ASPWRRTFMAAPIRAGGPLRCPTPSTPIRIGTGKRRRRKAIGASWKPCTRRIKRMMIKSTSLLAAALLMFGVTQGVAAEKEYILTGAKPDKLYLVDAKARTVAKEYVVPGPGVGPGTIVPSPDNSIAYIVTNHTKSVTGIDLRTGKEVFRADMAHADDERTVNLGLAVSPDGKKLYSYEIPARILGTAM